MSNHKPINGFHGYFITPSGHVLSNRQGTLRLIPGSNLNGYLRVGLRTTPTAGLKMRLIHSIVAEHYLGPAPTPQHRVMHRDGNKHNNAVANLIWATPAEIAKQHPHRITMRGETHSHAKLTERDVITIRIMAGEGIDHHTIANQYNMHPDYIRDLIRGKYWRHLNAEAA